MKPEVNASSRSRYWFLRGEFHRVHGPAIEYSDGTKFWLLNDHPHRDDGPAIEHADGRKEWWTHGNFIRSERGDFPA